MSANLDDGFYHAVIHPDIEHEIEAATYPVFPTGMPLNSIGSIGWKTYYSSNLLDKLAWEGKYIQTINGISYVRTSPWNCDTCGAPDQETEVCRYCKSAAR